ncbi:hypothetical protein BASA50_003202 [Batrachochytrium salamandrivorans]|uniref:Importin N-terminal domain-containing protein n=1 Tax=Batrachochytrium salamandrivorans TaxID=1357716 RepID=A0ABQ8FJJ1_9FUNG|nr:hypothetical protein BASA60_000058 [Batrachochytrium salamandrivorans]KAH6563429.1 hypothetical protein BASA62_008523 [Batrachochytrium salamandrivorans]KAH6599174.1 hypothetical protein BASA50_003202 [Batrachochytrium salamandrivorans]KAH6601820.1 hypothetical protein BASA61_001713 [Batrachochytrium salamandrivorans]
MVTSNAPVTIQQVLEALDAFYNFKAGTGSAAKDAGLWLETFQKTPAGWSISDSIIRQATLPTEARLFAAQTFRQKIEYDLDDLDTSSRESLRDALIQLLYDNRVGTKNMKTQLCLSLADLAIQMTSWTDPVSHMIELLHKDPEMMGVLLKFLSVLPEELAYNNKIHIDVVDANLVRVVYSSPKKKADMLSKTQSLLTNNSVRVVELLLGHLPLAADDTARCDILTCLYSWLRSGDISVSMIEASPIVDIAFQALGSPELFDVAVDMVCEIISRSAKKPQSPKLIEMIYPKLLPLIPVLKESADDSVIVLGLCRIFVEAGEGYAELVAGNMATFQVLLDGLLFCAAYDDLEIVKVTFNVWNYISDALLTPQYAACKTQYIPVYTSLIDIILVHLRYPEDLGSWTAQERDDFRDFRHVMGDVLKDCVRVLGDEAALARPFSILRTFFTLSQENGNTETAQGPTAADLSWPKIEAPLFSLRAMCREVSFSESRFLPEIMAMLPQLPNHPKIKYAAILVIGRYAEWTNEHPEMLSYQLKYVSSSFDQDKETIAAASQTFRDLCKYCSKHLVNLLSQLHPFYVHTIESVTRDNRRQLTEAVAHIISAVPLAEFSTSMQLFVHPVAQKLHAFVAIPGQPDVIQFKEAILTIGELATLFQYVVPEIPLSETHPCIQIVGQMWPIIQALHDRHGKDITIAECAARLLQSILSSYKQHALPILPQLIEFLVQQFESTGFSCHLWIAGRCVRIFGDDEKDEGRLVCMLVEKLTTLVFGLVQASGQSMDTIDEVIEEYHMLLSEFIDSCPKLFLGSALWTSTIQCALFCLSAPSPISLVSVLRYFNDLISLGLPSQKTVPVAATAQVRDMLIHNGPDIAKAMLRGLVFTFPRDREIVGDIAKAFQVECEVLGTGPALAFVRSATESSFPVSELSVELREAFLHKMGAACAEGNMQRIASVLQDFAASYARRNLINSRK